MRRFLAVLAASVPAVTGCVDAGIPTPGNGVGREGWWIVNDPATDRSFRCLYWSLDDSTAIWCYEPQAVAT